MNSDSYNFTCKLTIEMYLGKHDAYSILNTTHVRWAVAILPCCNRKATSGGGTKCACKKLSCQHSYRTIHTKTLNSTKHLLQSKKQCVWHKLHCRLSRHSPHADIYHLLQLRDNKVSFREVTPFYLTLRTVNKIWCLSVYCTATDRARITSCTNTLNET